MASKVSSIFLSGWKSARSRVTNIALDYRDVAVDVADKANKHPFKAICWSTGILCSILAFRTRPDKQDYIDTLMRGANEMALVAESSRNQKSVDALLERRKAISSGHLRVVNVLFASVVLTHPSQSEGCELFSDQCKLVRPPLFTWQEYLLDVGVLGRWLVLEKRLEHYDVNEDDL